MYLPTGAMWPVETVNARIPPVPLRDSTGKPLRNEEGKIITMKANLWLDRHQAVSQVVWAPGKPQLIVDYVVDEGGWIERPGTVIANQYRPPTLPHGDPTKAGPWIDHVRKVYPDDATHIICYLAHRVQRPWEKINHAIVLGGPQGIGKDTLLEPVKRAVGPWNVKEVSPQQVMGRFNNFVKSVILRISEMRDQGETNRFALYEHLKVFLAAPPDVIRVDEKYLPEQQVVNVCGVVITSNRQDSFYIPADDRRHYVAWTRLTKDDFDDAHWNRLWGWYDSGGDQHVGSDFIYRSRTLSCMSFDALQWFRISRICQLSLATKGFVVPCSSTVLNSNGILEFYPLVIERQSSSHPFKNDQNWPK
jgi:hypothetical protein